MLLVSETTPITSTVKTATSISREFFYAFCFPNDLRKLKQVWSSKDVNENELHANST